MLAALLDTQENWFYNKVTGRLELAFLLKNVGLGCPNPG